MCQNGPFTVSERRNGEGDTEASDPLFALSLPRFVRPAPSLEVNVCVWASSHGCSWPKAISSGIGFQCCAESGSVWVHGPWRPRWEGGKGDNSSGLGSCFFPFDAPRLLRCRRLMNLRLSVPGHPTLLLPRTRHKPLCLSGRLSRSRSLLHSFSAPLSLCLSPSHTTF